MKPGLPSSEAQHGKRDLREKLRRKTATKGIKFVKDYISHLLNQTTTFITLVPPTVYTWPGLH